MRAETARCPGNGAVAVCELSRVLSLLSATAHQPHIVSPAHRRYVAGTAPRDRCALAGSLGVAARGAARGVSARVARALAVRAQLAGHLPSSALQPAG